MNSILGLPVEGWASFLLLRRYFCAAALLSSAHSQKVDQEFTSLSVAVWLRLASAIASLAAPFDSRKTDP